MTDRNDRERINQVLEITNVPTGEFPTQKEAAERMRLSPAAFSRFFKKHIGKTYVDYVIDLRIATVCRSLIEGDRGITEIAFEAGFESLSNFNRQFRQRKGVSPHGVATEGSAGATKIELRKNWRILAVIARGTVVAFRGLTALFAKWRIE